MADVNGVPILSCCPPGFHDECAVSCLDAPIANAYNFEPKSRVWFTLNFVHRVMFCGNLVGWTFQMGEDGRALMKYDSSAPVRAGDDLTPLVRAPHIAQGSYVWRLTGERGGPENFWHEGVWPD